MRSSECSSAPTANASPMLICARRSTRTAPYSSSWTDDFEQVLFYRRGETPRRETLPLFGLRKREIEFVS